MNELITAMKARGFSNRTLSEKLGINESYISLLRNGKRSPSPDLIKKIKAEFPDLANMADVVFLNLVR